MAALGLRRSVRRFVLVGVVMALAWPAAASAHIRTGTVAVSYRATITHVPRGVVARVYPGDLALGLSALPGHRVTLLGYLGEPFARVDSHDATIFKSAPTSAAAAVRIQKSGPRVVWHDARLRGLRARTTHGKWAVPLVVDGHRARLSGTLVRLPAPAAWPWAVVGVPFVAAAALLLLRRSPRYLELGAFALGGIVVASVVATAAGFGFDANASEGRWVEGATEVLFAAVGVAVLVRGRPETRVLAAGALGLLGLAVGASKIPVFTHAIVLSLLPGTAARLTLAVMIWASAAAVALGAAVFAAVLE
ncbi:MAG TPA: hypothetical protein VF101_00140 [Gaiellaceae bacterium]